MDDFFAKYQHWNIAKVAYGWRNDFSADDITPGEKYQAAEMHEERSV